MAICYRAALVLSVLFLSGCGGANKKYAVSGTVTFNKEPIADGYIIFHDLEQDIAPDAGKITNGKFDFKAKAGEKKVEIRASRMEKYPPGQKGAMGETDRPVDYIPERFGKKSDVKASVTSGSNTFTFETFP
jgi:hypothetical protein